MLRNPAHLFRKDARIFNFPLFTAKLLPRTAYAIKSINYCAAWKHLVKNNVVNEIPNKNREIMNDAFYFCKHLDLRPEHPVIDGFRIAVITEQTDSIVVSKLIKKIFVKASNHVFNQFAKDIDVIFCINNEVFYVCEEYLKEEIKNFLWKTQNFKGQYKEFQDLNINLQNHALVSAYLIRKSYEKQEQELEKCVEKVENTLKDKKSLVSV